MTQSGAQSPDFGRRQLFADASLALVALIWGSTFALVKDVVEQVSPLLFLSARFMLGAVALALVTLVLRRWGGLHWRELRWGALTAGALWAGYALQTVGIQYTTASNAGFITGLQVVFVPVLGFLFLKQKPDRWSLPAVAAATFGLALLSLRLQQGISLNTGDPIVLGCALAFGSHVLLVAHVTRWADPLRFTTIQMIVAGLLSSFATFVFERPVSSMGAEIWGAAAFLGLVATAIAFLIQVTMQRFTSAVHTALIFTLEPVFAGIFGAALQGDRLGPQQLAGAALIILGAAAAEIGPVLAQRRAARVEPSGFG